MSNRKPQEPIRPFPYIEKEVEFTNSIDGTVLNGTLSLPDDLNRYPAVILVTGSGAQNRDEEILGHKPFLVIADSLTRAGIAVLRYDDRHFKMPIKRGWDFTTMDFAGDAKAAIDYLYNHGNIDNSYIGIIGHSEGGVIAPIVASSDSRVAFIISLAGTGVSGYELAKQQASYLSENEKDKLFSMKSHEIICNEPNKNLRKRKILKLSRTIYGIFNIKQYFALRGMIDMIVSEWNRFFISYDPYDAWSRTKCPVMVLIGEHDIQVLPDENINAIREALLVAGNKKSVLIKEPNLNHLFQNTEAVTKGYSSLINQYKDNEETFSPNVINEMINWIKNLTK